jgi:hypothetical protein
MILQNIYLLNLSKSFWYLERTYLVVELKECKKLKEVISKCQHDLLRLSKRKKNLMILQNTYLLNLSKLCWYLERTYLVVELKECKKLKEIIFKC